LQSLRLGENDGILGGVKQDSYLFRIVHDTAAFKIGYISRSPIFQCSIIPVFDFVLRINR
jgi:hypothetical protein